MPESNRTELKRRYTETLTRIESACERAGRDVSEITLIAVSKTFPVDVVQNLYDLGHRDFGENKAQELLQKMALLDKLGGYEGIRWHMIGHLQRNKVRQVVDAFYLFHGLDSDRLARELDTRAKAAGIITNCLIQVNISGEESKYGIRADRAADFAEKAESFEFLNILGFMGMAGHSENNKIVRAEFSTLRKISSSNVLKSGSEQSSSTTSRVILSMGMSQDFELAIEEGATHIRVGSAIFGSRTYS